MGFASSTGVELGSSYGFTWCGGPCPPPTEQCSFFAREHTSSEQLGLLEALRLAASPACRYADGWFSYGLTVMDADGETTTYSGPSCGPSTGPRDGTVPKEF
ncbi:MAG TPA: hypothetical protein VFQ61_19070, partial [Polyangiaceae bacterium]|nr:hypothetical protein [Polyangiaceae bacterium]